MDKIAFIIGETFIYWQSLILMLAAAAAISLFLGLYIGKSGNVIGAVAMVPLALISSWFLARLLHWYCQATAYESFSAAMQDWSSGGFALMGVFAGCLLTACLLRAIGLVRNLPELTDCMVLAGAAGIAVGRLAFLYSPSDRGMVLHGITELPLAYPVTNTVTGATEYRLATFMLQAIVTGAVFLVLLVPLLYRLRFSEYILIDNPRFGGFRACLESLRMTRRRWFPLLKLDLFFWWYYVLSLLVGLLSYMDLLPGLLGFARVSVSETMTLVFYGLYLIAQALVYYFFRPRLEVSFALLYDAYRPKEEPGQGMVLGNIFQM